MAQNVKATLQSDQRRIQEEPREPCQPTEERPDHGNHRPAIPLGSTWANALRGNLLGLMDRSRGERGSRELEVKRLKMRPCAFHPLAQFNLWNPPSTPANYLLARRTPHNELAGSLQRFGTALPDRHVRVGDAGHPQRDSRRDVGLDQGGEHPDRVLLRNQDAANPGGPAFHDKSVT